MDIPFFDCHSHNPSRQGELVIVQADVERMVTDYASSPAFSSFSVKNVSSGNCCSTLPRSNKSPISYISIGLHPWDVERFDTNKVFNTFVNNLQNDENHHIVTIGECGLDKLCTTSLDLQREVFIKHVELSERFSLPVIVHCVKAMDELLRLRREIRPTLPWIWHGFRGKPQQMYQLLDAGMYISFGFRHNAQSIAECPVERMLFETDCDERPVSLLYEQTGISPKGIKIFFP